MSASAAITLLAGFAVDLSERPPAALKPAFVGVLVV
jgi:hypothetical protein